MFNVCKERILSFFVNTVCLNPSRDSSYFIFLHPTHILHLIYRSRLKQSAKKRQEWYRKIASILLDTRFHSRFDTPICMQRRLFLSSSDSDKFIVTFILNPFDPPFPLRTPVSFSSRSHREIHSDFASGPEVLRRSLRWIVSLLIEFARPKSSPSASHAQRSSGM